MNTPASTTPTQAEAAAVQLRAPVVADGTRMWEIARDSQVLDLNSSYAYVLWCHDFAATSVVAEVDGVVGGFVTGYRRQDNPEVFMVWQVAVDADDRGLGIGVRMLADLLERAHANGMRWLHTTISPDNEASKRLFAAAARQRGVGFNSEKLFAADDFPDSHLDEDLYIVGPL